MAEDAKPVTTTRTREQRGLPELTAEEEDEVVDFVFDPELRGKHSGEPVPKFFVAGGLADDGWWEDFHPPDQEAGGAKYHEEEPEQEGLFPHDAVPVFREKSGWIYTAFLNRDNWRIGPGECLVVRFRYLTTFSVYGGGYVGCCLPGSEDDVLEKGSDSRSDWCWFRNLYGGVWGNASADGKSDDQGNAYDDGKHHARETTNIRGRLEHGRLGPDGAVEEGQIVELRLDYTGQNGDGGVFSVNSAKELEDVDGDISKSEGLVATGLPAGVLPYFGLHSTSVRILSILIEGRAMTKSARKR